MTGQYDRPNTDDSVRAADDAPATDLGAGFDAFRADGRGIARERFVQVIEGLAAIVASLDQVVDSDTGGTN